MRENYLTPVSSLISNVLNTFTPPVPLSPETPANTPDPCSVSDYLEKKSYRSTNGNRDAGQEKTEGLFFPEQVCVSKGPCQAPGGVLLTPEKSYQRIYDDAKGKRETVEQFESRDALTKTLRKMGISRSEFSDNSWDYVYKFKETAAASYLSAAAKAKDEYREYRHRACHWLKRKGAAIVHEGGVSYQDVNRCSEKFCLRCEKKRKNKLSSKLLERVQAIAYSNSDFPGVLQLVFTLPETVEGKPLHDNDLQKKILAEIHGFIREIFGLGTRGNIGCQLSVHPVGGKDLYRDRWHVHADIIPVTTNQGVATWHYPSLTRADSVRTNPWEKIDYVGLRDLWREKLVKLFGDSEVPEKIPNVQTTFLDYQEQEFDPKSVYWSKLAHALKYNQRSFVEDLEAGVLLTDVAGDRIVRKAAVGWRLVSSADEVERFMWIREKAVTRARGVLQALKQHADALGLTYECKKLILPWVEPLGDAPVVTGIYPATISEYKDKVVEKYVQYGVGGVKDRNRARVLRKTVRYIEYTDEQGIKHSGEIDSLCVGEWKWPRLLIPFGG